MDAIAYKAVFYRTNLCDANLTRLDALKANLQQAILTGACIKDWKISSATNLRKIQCDYIYQESQHQERRPHNPETTFAEGEFTQRFQKILETVDLFFVDGVDWKAFLSSFQKLQTDYGNENVAVQGIERKGPNSFEIRLAVAPVVSKAEIEQQAYEQYEAERHALESKYLKQLATKDGKISALKDELLEVYRRESRASSLDMIEVLKLVAGRPNNIAVTVEAKSVADGKQYDLSQAKFGGGFADTVQGDQIGTQHNYAPEKQDLAEAAADIQKLLKQLEENNPTATETEKKTFISMGIGANKKQRLINAVKSGGKAAIEEFLDNPYLNVAIAIIEGWKENEGSE